MAATYPPLLTSWFVGELLRPGPDGRPVPVRPQIAEPWQQWMASLQAEIGVVDLTSADVVGPLPQGVGGTGAATFKAAGLVEATRLKTAVIVGGAAGNRTLPGVAVGDRLVAVTRFVGAGVAVTDVADMTAEFTITAGNTINNAGGTNTTGDKLSILWVDLT